MTLVIDLGTVNTVGWASGRAVTVDGAPWLPTAVHAGVVGADAVALGRGQETRDLKETLDPAALQAIFARMIAAARAQGADVAEIVVTHPVAWDASRVAVLAVAAGAAGAIAEPIAVAAGQGMAVGETVLVVDAGGGTWDVTAVHRTPEGYAVSAHGTLPVGGNDLDGRIVERVRPSLRETEDDPAALLESARAGKEHLSRHDSTEIVLPDHRAVRLDRLEFEQLITPEVDRLVALVGSVGAAAPFDRVLLVGGSSRVPLLGHRLGSATGRTVVTDPEPETAVVRGAHLLTRPGVMEDPLAEPPRSAGLQTVVLPVPPSEPTAGTPAPAQAPPAQVPTAQAQPAPSWPAAPPFGERLPDQAPSAKTGPGQPQPANPQSDASPVSELLFGAAPPGQSGPAGPPPTPSPAGQPLFGEVLFGQVLSGQAGPRQESTAPTSAGSEESDRGSSAQVGQAPSPPQPGASWFEHAEPAAAPPDEPATAPPTAPPVAPPTAPPVAPPTAPPVAPVEGASAQAVATELHPVLPLTPPPPPRRWRTGLAVLVGLLILAGIAVAAGGRGIVGQPVAAASGPALVDAEMPPALAGQPLVNGTVAGFTAGRVGQATRYRHPAGALLDVTVTSAASTRTAPGPYFDSPEGFRWVFLRLRFTNVDGPDLPVDPLVGVSVLDDRGQRLHSPLGAGQVPCDDGAQLANRVAAGATVSACGVVPVPLSTPVTAVLFEAPGGPPAIRFPVAIKVAEDRHAPARVIGEVGGPAVNIGGLRARVELVNTPSGYLGARLPAPGHRFVIVRVAATAAGDRHIAFFLRDDRGALLHPLTIQPPMSGCPALPDQLAPNTPAYGCIVYEIAAATPVAAITFAGRGLDPTSWSTWN